MRVIRLLALLVFCASAYAFPGPASAAPIAASALAAQTSVSGEGGLIQNAYWRRHYYRPYYHHYYYRPHYRHYYHRPYYHHYYYRPHYRHYGWRRHYWHRHYW
jgi:hypothetical protein